MNITLTIEDFWCTSKSAKGSQVAKRLRPPRVSLGDGILRQFDARSAHGCDSMRRLREGSWKDNRYIGFCVLDGSEAVLVTDKHVCVHCFNDHQVVWQVPIGKVGAVKVDNKQVIIESSEKPVKQDNTAGRNAQQSVSCSISLCRITVGLTGENVEIGSRGEPHGVRRQPLR